MREIGLGCACEVATLFDMGLRRGTVRTYLEHYLVERRGRRLDTDQIQAYQSAIHAVRECIRLAPALDAALGDVLSAPLDFSEPE